MNNKSFLLCKSCRKRGFIRPSHCCPSKKEMKAGDYVEFLSDKQTEKGPSSGMIEISCGDRILISHSDCSEEFSINTLAVNEKAEHRHGGTLWLLA